MLEPFDDQKKRPPPIAIPVLPRHAFGYATQPNVQPQQQRQQQQQSSTRNASSSTQQGPRSATSPRTSPSDPDIPRVPHSGSQKSRTSAMTALSSMMDQTRGSPRRSEHGSTMGKSTAQSRHSERSQHSATAAQAQLEALDEDDRTSRAKIESRGEKSLFKMTGQVPPTPIVESVGPDEIIILRQDLREQCRVVSTEKKPDYQEPVKSPKKKIFGMHLPTFGRSSTPTPAPAMPSKAAQVFGKEPRNPTKAVVRPIKPAVPLQTPTKAPRSETTKSLPSKLLNQSIYTHSHHSGAARRNRVAKRSSPPRGSKQSSEAAKPTFVPGFNSSFESCPPPTPPAKDTPPNGRGSVQPASPLRRAAPSDHLREDFSVGVDHEMRLPFPAFVLSPSPDKAHDADAGGLSPTKYQPCTADEYHKLITGEPLPWASLSNGDSFWKPTDTQGVSTTAIVQKSQHRAQSDDCGGEKSYEQDETLEHNGRNTFLLGSMQLPRPDHWSKENRAIYSNRDSRQHSPLQPRFYSPLDRSVQQFADGETPSKNSDASRLLCTVTSRAELFNFPDDSNNGSIEMIFQGDVNDIDPQSSTGHLVKNSRQDSMRDESGLAARVMQELRIDDQREGQARPNGIGGHLRPDQSSSRLTDMLNGLSPSRGDYQGDFRTNCPSAVPSPLHKLPSPITPMRTNPMSREVSGPFGPPLSPKTIEDHFYMTNEHLDVVGKSTWDQIETMKKEHTETFSNKHALLVTTVEQHVHEIKMQVDSVNEKADRTTEQGHNIQTKLDELFELIKTDVMGALAAQEKKAAGMEQNVKELQRTVQAMQKTLELKHSESRIGQQHNTPGSVPTPNSSGSPFALPVHRSQPSLAGYYGNMTESGREGQPLMPHNGVAQDVHNDPRPGYATNYGQQWGPRGGYQGRNGKEDRPYSGTNPYHFANNSGGGGQYSNGYTDGYAAYSSPDQHYGFQGQAK